VAVNGTLVVDAGEHTGAPTIIHESPGEGPDMGKIYRISCRDVGVDCDFEAQGSSMDEIMQLCAEHGIQAHNMKGFGPELYMKMRNCVHVLDEGVSGSTEESSKA
jgi:predicted small metal-binding protein